MTMMSRLRLAWAALRGRFREVPNYDLFFTDDHGRLYDLRRAKIVKGSREALLKTPADVRDADGPTIQQAYGLKNRSSMRYVHPDATQDERNAMALQDWKDRQLKR